ncbi:hypothetical protein JM654_13070 [Microbacterium oxydans]|nr:hypothetical protein [Microbacterium oxydans]
MAEAVDVTGLQALGDVEFVVVRLDDDRLGSTILGALLRQVESGTIRLLDFLVVRRLSITSTIASPRSTAMTSRSRVSHSEPQDSSARTTSGTSRPRSRWIPSLR